MQEEGTGETTESESDDKNKKKKKRFVSHKDSDNDSTSVEILSLVIHIVKTLRKICCHIKQVIMIILIKQTTKKY